MNTITTGRSTTHRSDTVGACLIVLGASAGCQPVVNVAGTYFPASLVSAAIGLCVGYVVVRLMARRAALRSLAESASFFLGLSSLLGACVWWGLFVGF